MGRILNPKSQIVAMVGDGINDALRYQLQTLGLRLGRGRMWRSPLAILP